MKVTCIALLTIASATHGQQVADRTFQFNNTQPAFAANTGPVVCVDAAHRNVHTLDEGYYAFGTLLRGDGFRTMALREPFNSGIRDDCAVLVIANAAAPLVEDEVRQLLRWIVAGGRVLLVMDHAPYPRFVERLSTAVGASPFNGGATYRVFGTIPDTMVRRLAEESRTTIDSVLRMVGAVGSLGDHPILRGRPGADPPVRTIDTFGGSVFYPAPGMRALLRVPGGTVGEIWWPDRFSPANEPRYALDGWLAGGAGEVGSGRVVILGEAAMCSAQLAGAARTPMGMNAPLAVDNARFCLNIIRWLAGAL